MNSQELTKISQLLRNAQVVIHKDCHITDLYYNDITDQVHITVDYYCEDNK